MPAHIKPLIVVRLPQLTGTAEKVGPLLDRWLVPADLSDTRITLDAWRTLANTDSFCDEIVHELLVNRRAVELYVIRAGPLLTASMMTAARQYDVERLVQTAEGLNSGAWRDTSAG